MSGQSKGVVNKGITKEPCSGRGLRPAGRISVRGQGRGQIVDALHISERPAEADDRAGQGHWEGVGQGRGRDNDEGRGKNAQGLGPT